VYKKYTLPSLAVFALLPVDIYSIVRDIEDAQTFIRTLKGFSLLSVSKQELLLFAAGIVASVYADDIKSGLIKTSISTSITSIIIAQQAAMIAAVVAASAASSAGE
jgi:hypothetical protein